MSNIVEFVLKLTDMMSVPFAKVTNKSDVLKKSLEDINRSSARLHQQFSQTGHGINDLRGKIDRLTARRNLLPSSAETQIRSINREIKALNSEVQRLENMNGKGFGHWLKTNAAALPGVGILANPFVLAGVAGKGLVDMVGMGMNADKTKTSMQVLAGDAAGGKLYDQLTQYARDTIWGNEVYGNAQTMMGFGIDSEKVMPYTKMLSDVSMGDKNKLQSLTLAFSQIQSAGKLTGQDLLQLINAGFNPLGVISEKTGISIGDLKKKMEEGAISAQMVEQAFIDATGPTGRFFNMTERIAATPFGKWEALKGQIEGLGTKIGLALQPLAAGLLDAVAKGFSILEDAMRKVAGWFKGLWGWMQENKTGLMALLTAITTGFVVYQAWQGWQMATYLWMMRGSVAQALYAKATVFSTAMTTLFTSSLKLLRIAFLQTPIGWIVTGLGAIVGVVVYAWNKFEGFRGFLFGLWKSIKKIFSNIGSIISAVFAPLADGIAALMDGRWMDAGRAFIKMNPISLTTRLVSELTSGKLTEGVSDAWQRGSEAGIKHFRDERARKANKADGKNELDAMLKGSASAPGGYAEIFGDGSGNKAGKIGSGITGSGPRQITINIQKEMIGQLSVNSVNLREGLGEVESLVKELMYRTIISLQTA